MVLVLPVVACGCTREFDNGLMGVFMRLSLILFAILSVGLFGSFAYADGCDNLDANVRWVQLFQELSTQVAENDNDAAFDTAEKLTAICEESPILNYAIARIYRNLGNNAKELYYLQRATMFTEKFSVNPDTMEVLWYERYEAEHPDCRKSEKAQKTIEQLNRAVLEAQKQRYETQIATERKGYDHADRYRALMWGGVAVGVTGIALLTTGTVLVAMNRDEAVSINYTQHQTHAKPIWGASWGLLGAGIVATIAGAAAAGFGGYHYAQTRKDKSVSIELSSNSVSLSYSF